MIIPKNPLIRWLAVGLIALGLPVRAADLTAYTENLPPLNYLSEGPPAGFTVELVQKLAQESGLSIDIRLMPWLRAYQTARQTPDSLLFTLVRLPEREAQFAWLGPIAKRRVALYRLASRNDIRVHALADARRYRIGVVRESAATRQMLAAGFRFEHELEAGNDDLMNMKKLRGGRIDLLLALDASAHFNLRQLAGGSDELVEVLVLDAQSDYYIGASTQMQPAKLRALRQAFARLQQRYFAR